MQKKIILGLLLSLTILLFAGCNATNNTDSKGESDTQGESSTSQTSESQAPVVAVEPQVVQPNDEDGALFAEVAQTVYSLYNGLQPDVAVSASYIEDIDLAGEDDSEENIVHVYEVKADGEEAPPTKVYKSKGEDNWMVESPDGEVVGISVDSANMYDDGEPR